jgi:hypothetical protein
MTPDQLIQEGRRLQRRTVVLTPDGTGPVAAIWYGHRSRRTDHGRYRCWLSVAAELIPDASKAGWLSVFTDDECSDHGHITLTDGPFEAGGVPLYAREVPILPPLEAVIWRGSEAIGEWLRSHGCERRLPYSTVLDRDPAVKAYISLHQEEAPLFSRGIYATLGGWHTPWEYDWEELADERLLVHTFEHSEPWVEVWQLRSGGFRVIERIT